MKFTLAAGLAIFCLSLASCERLHEIREALRKNADSSSIPHLNPSDFRTDTVEGRFSISSPRYMISATELNSDASFQRKNVLKGTFLMVIEENKNEYESFLKKESLYNDSMSLIDNYKSVVIEHYANKCTKLLTKDSMQATINGCRAIIQIVDASIFIEGAEYDAQYALGFIEGRKNLYQVWTWTMSPGMSRYRNDFEYSIRSLKEF